MTLKRFFFASLLTSASVYPTMAFAQTDGVASDEIIVTARRTEERIQDVPVAITALSGEDLETRNITDMRSLGNVASGLTIAEANTPSTLVITIRGLANVNPLTGSDATVGFYFNDVPINIQSGTNLALYDIENVQVLKGPQGTLFGRNTTGGALLINSAKPTRELGGYVKAGGTFFRAGSGFQGEAAINLPMSESLSLRVAGKIVDRDGFVRNILSRDAPAGVYGFVPLPYGRTKFENLLKEKSQAARVSLLFEPNDTIESLTVYDYAHMRGDGLPTFATALNPDGPVVAFAPFLGFPDPTAAYAALVEARKNYFWTTYNIADTPLHVTTHTVSNTTSIELSDTITLKNIAGYRDVHEDYGQDIVGLPGAYFTLSTLNTGYDFSEELQLQGRSADARLTWVTGLFYFEESRDYSNNPIAFGSYSDKIIFNIKSRSYSVFGQASYKLTDALSLTAGGRYNIDKRSADMTRFYRDANGDFDSCRFTGGTVDNCRLQGRKKYKAFTYTLSLDYKVDDDTLLYVASRRGYRAGGFSNTQTTLDTGYIPFAPEKVTDYEFGFKREWNLGGGATLLTNGAIYYQDYKDVQRLAVDPADFTNQLIVNAAKATVAGGELDVTLMPNSWLSLSYSYSHVVPKYKNFIVAGVDYSDTTFAYSSRHTHNISFVAELPLSGGNGELILNADYRYQSKQFYDGLVQDTAGGTYPAHTLAFGGYEMVNAKATWRGVMGSDFDLDAFVNNLTNTKLLPNGTPSTYTTLGNAIGFYALPPRMAGFNIRYNF